MTRVRTVVLDNEAVRALRDVRHHKHRRALAMVEAVAARQARQVAAVRLVVPTAVRVEAGWDRGAAGAAIVNRLRVDDAALDRIAADQAAGVRVALRVSVADAHLAAVLAQVDRPLAVLTSDVDDVRRISAHLSLAATVVAL